MGVYSRPIWVAPTAQYRAHPGSLYMCSENVRKISTCEEYRNPTIINGFVLFILFVLFVLFRFLFICFVLFVSFRFSGRARSSAIVRFRV